MSNKKRLPPGKAARAFCLECMCGQRELVKDCPSKHCPIYPHRMGKGRVTLKLIRTYCLHCMGWELKDGKLDPACRWKGEAAREAKVCTDRECPFYPYRPGTKPYRRSYKEGRFHPARAPLSAPEMDENEATLGSP